MKILYIQPWNFSDYTQIERFQRGYLKKLSLPRVMFEVLYFVANLAEFEILDLNLELLENPQKSAKQILQEKLQGNFFNAIFLTFPTVALGNLVGEIINWCKELAPQSMLVVGGEAVELMTEDIMKFWPVDYLYCGYGQEIPLILEQINRPEKFQEIHGLYHRSKKGIIFPEVKRGEAKLLDNYQPKNFYSLKGKFNFQGYLNRYFKLGFQPSASIEMMRGCSHKCTFCAINKIHKVLFRQPKIVAAEAAFLLQHRVSDFYLIDPTLGLNKKFTEKLLFLLAQVKVNYPELKILGVTRTSLITEIFTDKLKKAGFETIGLGIETMTNRQLNKIKKKLIPQQAEKAVKILDMQKIKVKLFLIHFPTIFSQETIEFLLKLHRKKIDFIVQSSFYRPLYQKSQFASLPDFRQFDQRLDCRNFGLDSASSILEWLLVNLAFPSTDIDSKQGDQDLAKLLTKSNFNALNIPAFKNLALIIKPNKYFLYLPKVQPEIIKPNLYKGADLQYLSKIPNLTIINLSKEVKNGKRTGGSYAKTNPSNR
ncbi:MAG: hypothetical protein A2Y82_05350 [Candidatus Buchananbacteria bacterium RBG_13_36_9]|uniref:Radical SAM core domain-containing protein n=1 Tax=Candidatus Buchananbacteria bacterium RBG_13_36_9 TaxID=1797530 RepID=A0A1G1XPK0_9BACT|nr:MAG: hypothetical protein A2Y82_05350 [Candidatus Buchananbacteria bacterium RBG_13_36_9]